MSCGHMLAKDWLLGSPVCDVLLCLCHFPLRYPGSGVVLDVSITDICLLSFIKDGAECLKAPISIIFDK